MATDDDSSELSSLSSLSPAPSEDELGEASDAPPAKSKSGILKFFPKLSELPPKQQSPPPRKRSPSPPHEYVLADNPDIAFIVMFRSRFSDAFPKSLSHFGPQELERDVVGQVPGDRVEHFLCAVLGLLLNRKQDVKPGHYGRALEDAIASHKSQWAPAWNDKNPVSGSATFNTMTPTERLTLLRTLILWAMSSSDTLKTLINLSYKQNRHEDDLNQPRAVQPWGSDGDKRRYFLVEGQDETNFRIYRESNPAGTSRTWRSVAGSIEELRAVSEKLETKDGGPKAKKLSQKMLGALPRFEAGEDKRRRREYRLTQRERFKRPEPGFSLYEGRTRGKRIKYTYSDEEEVSYSDSTSRRSARNTGTHTPAETGPVTTSSGRQIKAPIRMNADADSAAGSVKGGTPDIYDESSIGATGRPRRSAAASGTTNGRAVSNTRSRRNDSADTDEESEEAEFGDDEDDNDAAVPEESEDEDDFDEDEAMVDDDLGQEPRLVVKLSVTPPKLRHALFPLDHHTVNALPAPNNDQEDEKPAAQARDAPVVEMQDAPALNGNAAGQSGHMSPPNRESITAVAAATLKVREASPEPVIRVEEVGSLNPSHVTATPLAFRGSPEKPPPQVLP